MSTMHNDSGATDSSSLPLSRPTAIPRRHHEDLYETRSPSFPAGQVTTVKALSQPLTPPEGKALALADLSVTQIQVAGATAHLLRRRDSAVNAPLVLHLHGGAYVSRPTPHAPLIARALAAAGATVVGLQYPLAPQHPFPQPLEAAYEALRWVHAQCSTLAGKRSPLFVAGEEAGGNLASALAQMTRDRGAPSLTAQILLSPLLDPMMSTASLRAAHKGHAQGLLAEGWRQYLPRSSDALHPYASPLQSQRLNGLPPTLVVTRQDDPHQDEAHTYAVQLRGFGVPVREHVLGGDASWPNGPADGRADPPWAAHLCTVFQQFFCELAAESTASSRIRPRDQRSPQMAPKVSRDLSSVTHQSRSAYSAVRAPADMLAVTNKG